MASTKTGLNIGADATVVAAAGQLAKAQQPFSMKGMTDNFVKTRGEFMESQTKQYEERMKEIEALNDGVKTAIAELETQLNDGTIDLQAERDILQLEVDGFRDRLQKVPRGKKGKKERDQILYEVNKMVKGRKKTGDAAADVIQTINNNLYQSNLLEPEFLGLITQMGLDGSKKEPTDDTFKKVKNSDGDYVYSYTHTKPDGTKVPVQGTIFEIQNKLKSAAPQTEFVTQVNESIFAQQADAVANPTVGFDVVYDRIINNLETSFNNNPDGFRGLIHSNVGWAKKSYVEALNDENSEEYKSIMNVLMEVQPSSLDLDGSGTVDGEDFASPENMSKMINILTNPGPGERRVAHALAAQFYADTEARRAYGIGTGSIQKTTTTTPTTDDNNFVKTTKSVQPTDVYEDKNKYVNKSSMNNLGLDINNHKDIELADGSFVSWNDAGYYQTVDGTIIPNKVSLLSTVFQGPLTNEFKLTDVYRSIEDWDGSEAAGSQPGRTIGSEFSDMIKANFKKGDRESATQGYLLQTLTAASKKFPQLKNMLKDFKDENLDYDITTGYALRYDVDGDGEPENYYFKSGQKDQAAEEFIAALNKRIARETVNNEFAQ
tara:strand:- start:5200 stop:7011 length:1812 start_codon:yes stop_codon:yes gene_type:complete